MSEIAIDGALGDATGSMSNQRRLWIREQLEQGTLLDRGMVEHEFGVSTKTAKRDLAGLTRLGVIEYHRVGRVGVYRLRTGEESSAVA